MIIDTIRNGKQVSIEMDKTGRTVAAHLDPSSPCGGKPPKPKRSMSGRRGHHHQDLGAAIFETEEWHRIRNRWAIKLNLGARPTLNEMAALRNCTKQAVEQQVNKVMRKIRAKLHCDKGLEQALSEYFQTR